MDISIIGVVLVLVGYLLITFKKCNLFVFHSLNLVGSSILAYFAYTKGMYAYTFLNAFMVVAAFIFIMTLPNEEQRKEKARLKIKALKSKYPDLSNE